MQSNINMPKVCKHTTIRTLRCKRSHCVMANPILMLGIISIKSTCLNLDWLTGYIRTKNQFMEGSRVDLMTLHNRQWSSLLCTVSNAHGVNVLMMGFLPQTTNPWCEPRCPSKIVWTTQMLYFAWKKSTKFSSLAGRLRKYKR